MEYSKLVPAVANAQAVLAEHYAGRKIGPPGRPASVMRIDGRWGTYTSFAYDSAPDDVRVEVRKRLAFFGYTPETVSIDSRSVFAKPADQPRPPPTVTAVESGMTRFLPYSVLSAHVRAALVELEAYDRLTAVKVPRAVIGQILDTIQGREIMDLEAARDRATGYYDAWSRNATSSARGWAQFLTGTWNEMVAQLALRKTITVPLRPVDRITRDVAAPGLPFDPVASAYVYAEYTLRNALALVRARLPVTAATLYTLHQQGTAGGIGILQGRKQIAAPQLQSVTSLNMIAQAIEQARRA